MDTPFTIAYGKFRQSLAHRNAWCTDMIRVSNEINEWEQYNGRGDAVWCLLLFELMYTRGMYKAFKAYTEMYLAEYEEAKKDAYAKVFGTAGPEDF